MKSQIFIFAMMVLLVITGTSYIYHVKFNDLVLIKRAEKELDKGNTEKAFKILGAIKSSARTSKSNQRLIDIYLAYSHYDKAIPLLIKRIEYSPSLEHIYTLVNVLQKTDSANEAIAYLEKKQFPDSINRIFNDHLITLYIEEKQYKKSEKLLKEKIRSCENNRLCSYFNKKDPYYALMMQLGSLYLLQEKIEDAAKLYETLNDTYVEKKELQIKTGEIMIMKNDFAQAKEHYKTLVIKYPKDYELKRRYINTLVWSGDKETIKLHLDSIKETSERKKLVQHLVDLYLEAQEFSAAEGVLRKYLTNNPDDYSLGIKLAKILSWQSKYQESAKEYRYLLKKNPDDIQLRRAYAQILHWMGEHELAASEFEKTLKGDLR